MKVQLMTPAVCCPKCGWRILDIVSPASGEIQIKCPRCRREVRLNLAKRVQD